MLSRHKVEYGISCGLIWTCSTFHKGVKYVAGVLATIDECCEGVELIVSEDLNEASKLVQVQFCLS